MGVVYKLKQEVIDFIVRKKKDDPSLSCRKLVDIITTDFGLNVSKSSVNAVIKQFNLSNPVGRQPVYKPPKNFIIPQEKKNLLLANVVPYLAPAEVSNPQVVQPEPGHPERPDPDQPAEIVINNAEQTDNKEVIIINTADDSINKAEAVAQPVEETAQPVEEAIRLPEQIASIEAEPKPLPEEIPAQQEQIIDEGPVGLSLPPDLLQEKSEEGVIPRPLPIELRQEDEAGSSPRGVWTDEVSPKYDGLGLFLFLAVLWDMETSPVVGEVLARHLGVSPTDQILSKLEAAAIVDAVLREKDGSILLDGIDGFLQACEMDQKTLAEWLHALGDANVVAGMEREMVSHFESQLTMVGQLRLLTEADQAYYIDPSFSICDSVIKNTYTIPGPLYTTVEKAVDTFVTNSVPVVIGSFPTGEPETIAGFYEAMEGSPGKGVKEVELLGLEGEKVFSVKNIFPVRKAFVVGIPPSKEQLAAFEADVLDNSREYYDPFFGKAYNYIDGTISINNINKIRAILIKEKQLDEKKIIITNMTSAPKEIVDVFTMNDYLKTMGINKYFEDKIGYNDSYYSNFIRKNSIHIPNLISKRKLSSNIFSYIDLISIFNDSNDINSLLKQFYAVPATFHEASSGLFIRFFPPQNYSLLKEITSMVALLNARGISNHAGRKVFFAISND